MNREPYRQVLPDLDLSIERFTESVPADGQWYVLKGEKEVGRVRRLHEPRRAEIDKALVRVPSARPGS